jgi:hypothetical protein
VTDLLAAVDATVAALPADPADTALIELARRYAAEIDGAAAWAGRADRHAQRVRAEHGEESALYEEVDALRAKLSERAALLAAGKALHAALAELLATPKGRGAKPAPAGSGGRLHALRGGLAG